MIFKITPGTRVSKANFYIKNKKSHLPALILKFFTKTPNLTSNFETHKNVGDNFSLHLLVDIYLIYMRTKYEEN